MGVELDLSAAELPADAVEVGRIAGAFGVQGWLRVHAYSSDPQAILASRLWYLLPPQRGSRPFDGARLLQVSQVRDQGAGIVAACDAVRDRDVAEALRGARIFVARSDFPPTGDEDEYYWVDLIGLDVVNREGVALGQVQDLLSNGLQTVLVLGEQAGEAGAKTAATRMIPFVSAYVDRVDVQARRITVDWQPDY